MFTDAAEHPRQLPVRIAGVNVGKVTSVEQLSAGDDELRRRGQRPRTATASTPSGQQAAS